MPSSLLRSQASPGVPNAVSKTVPIGPYFDYIRSTVILQKQWPG